MLKAARSCKKLQVNEIYIVHGSSICCKEGHMVRTKPRLYEYQERMGTLWRPTGAVNRVPGYEICCGVVSTILNLSDLILIL